MNSGSGMIANEDQWRLIFSVLSRRRAVVMLHRAVLKRDLEMPTQINEAYKTTKEMMARWSKARQAGQPMFFSQLEYQAWAMLAQWVVTKFHELKGSTPPESIKEWSVCHQAAGAKIITDIIGS